jgi:hypothetical protein
MAARARERQAQHDNVEAAWAREWAEIERQAIATRASMTLGEALELLNAPPWACACIGPPLCCRYSFIQARALQRGAHIVAKLLAEAGR